MSQNPRINSVDVLRGFSLLGILMMNIQSFALPSGAYINPMLHGSVEGLEGVAWSVCRVLFDFKFITLFSTLFGASLVLAGDASRPYRRLVWLSVMGLLHAYLVWYGDVLFTYGVVGLVVLPARQWPVRRLVQVGAALLVFPVVLVTAGSVFFPALPAWLRDAYVSHLEPGAAAAETLAFQGDWMAQFAVRARIAWELQTFSLVVETGWRAAGCMLLGMAAVKARVFEGSLPSPRFIGVLAAAGLALTLMGLWLQWMSGFDARVGLGAQALHELGSLGLSAGIGATVIALASTHAASRVVQSVARLGRVAFTAYLMQSCVGTWVFGGHGLGLFGDVSRATLLVAPLVFWMCQLVLAWRWTSQFRVGPLEAVWRGLSKGDWSLGPLAVHPSSTVRG